ncbi:hypothetical protein Thiowin_02029 [Thiorhodovibrio winogradskyi]|uniref:Uncharacterized protein n=1 Tax=Thiorhodovibrio winogradskyi TaxID=77007 RepID=A0ABZ0S8T9_9GAMM
MKCLACQLEDFTPAQCAARSARELQPSVLYTRDQTPNLTPDSTCRSRRLLRGHFWVDADACPQVIKDIQFRVAERCQIAGFYLLYIPTLARKIRVYLEWNWAMFSPPDIAHLRFRRTRDELDDKRRSFDGDLPTERLTSSFEIGAQDAQHLFEVIAPLLGCLVLRP